MAPDKTSLPTHLRTLAAVESAALSPQVSALGQAAVAAAERIERLEAALRGFLHWADQKCPCRTEEQLPCPLCGASVENLEACKAADMTLPRNLLAAARAALQEAPRDE